MITLSGWMLYTMWVVLGAIGLDMLAGLYRGIASNSLSITKLPGFLSAVLHYVLPMLILAQLTSIDSTGWLVPIAYYLGGLGITVKYLRDIYSKLF